MIGGRRGKAKAQRRPDDALSAGTEFNARGVRKTSIRVSADSWSVGYSLP